jgi:hypothetical protein
MKHSWLLNIALALVLLLPVKSAFGQEVFRGIVVDSLTIEALPAVSIQIKHTSRGTVTDSTGAFQIAAARTDTLIFSRVGYRILQIPLATYEAGVIRLNQQYTLLQAVTINEYRGRELYEGMFDEQNAQRQPQRLPFWISKDKKEQIKVDRLHDENLRVETYVDLIIRNTDVKTRLMARHRLTEDEYYEVLRAFNETHHEVMYYLTAAELISLLNSFFDTYAP